MSAYLIDTNVISGLSKPVPAAEVDLWFQQNAPEDIFVSVISFGELRLGIESLPDGKRKALLERWLEVEIPSWFYANLLPVTREVAHAWAALTAHAKRQGRNLSAGDGLIAATAQTLATGHHLQPETLRQFWNQDAKPVASSLSTRRSVH